MVDLPESLFYANSFIGLSFPDARIKYISEPTELTDSELNEYDFVFVPVQNCNTLAYCTFDVAINTFSFQEMPDASVIFWMNFIQKVVNVKAFYSWNYFLTNKRIQSEAGVDQESNLICPVLDPFWNLKYFHLNEHLPRVDCAKRNWLEIFVERIPETERVNIDLSKRGLEYFKMADCFVRGSHYWFGNLWMAIWCDINRAEYIDEFLRGIHEFAHGQSYGIVNVLDQRVPLYPNLKTLLRAVERISKSILRNALSRISSRFHYLKYDIENEYNELDFYRKLKQ